MYRQGRFQVYKSSQNKVSTSLFMTFKARQAIITLIPYYPGGFEYRVDNKYIAVRTRRNVHWVVPRGVTTVFTGRHEILKEIKGAILNSSCHGQQKRYIITGLGGLGKSELCLRIANDLRQSYVS
jgi:hypothetical protein